MNVVKVDHDAGVRVNVVDEAAADSDKKY